SAIRSSSSQPWPGLAHSSAGNFLNPTVIASAMRSNDSAHLDREPGAARRQADAAAGGLDHVIARHLHDVGAPIELLLLVFEKIASSESVAIGFDIAAAGIAGDRRVAP